MASIFRPCYTSTDKNGKRIKKKSPTWWIRYYSPDGQRHKVKGYRDKRATEALATELERKAQRMAAGLIDPTDEHAKRPLLELAEGYRAYLAAKGNTDAYVGLVMFRLTAVLDNCRFTRIADVQVSALLDYLTRLRKDAGKSVKTANEYVAAAKGFTRWLWRDKRARVDVLAGLSKLPNGETDVRHARRDLSHEELGRLLDAARCSTRTMRQLSGTDRYFLYLVACSTGFRVSELASMTPESFDLDAATAKVQAACTKNRREAIQPLPRDVAETLRDYLRDKPAGRLIWPAGSWRVHASILIRHDLANAREKWLSEAENGSERTRREQSDFLTYRDAEGRYADFHALRHSYVTMVGKAGVSPREHQDLARHSTYALTSRYSHSRFYDLHAAVQSLSIPTGGLDREGQALAATGTDGRQKTLGPFLGPQGAISGDFVRQAETVMVNAAGTKNPGNSKQSSSFWGFCIVGAKERDTGVEPV